MTPSASIATLTMNESGRKLRCSDPSFTRGGGGISVARVIPNMGGSTVGVVACGGPVGGQLERTELCKREYVNRLLERLRRVSV